MSTEIFKAMSDANHDINSSGDGRCVYVGVRNRQTGELGIMATDYFAGKQFTNKYVPIELRLEGPHAGKATEVDNFIDYKRGLTAEELERQYDIVDLAGELSNLIKKGRLKISSEQ